MFNNSVALTAKLAGVCPNTVRTYADNGLIDSKRNIHGWRYIADPIKAAKTLRELLSGEQPPNEKTEQN